MATMHSVIAMQYTQERIARAQAGRLDKAARDVQSPERSRRRAFRLVRRPVVAGAVDARR